MNKTQCRESISEVHIPTKVSVLFPTSPCDWPSTTDIRDVSNKFAEYI